MAKRCYAISGLIWQDIRRLLCSAKLYVVAAVLVVGMITCFGGVRGYLISTNMRINPLELYIMSVSNRISLWIVYTGAVVLICDAPFRYQGDTARIFRTGRKEWLTGQIVFSLFCVLIYHTILLVFFFALSYGHWDISGSWSAAIRSAVESQSSLGIVFGIRIMPGILNLTLCKAFVISVILQVLMGIFSACLLSLCYIWGYSRIGLFLCAAFPMVDYLLLDAFPFKWCEGLSYVVSPFSLSTWGRLKPVAPYGLTVIYAILYFLCVLSWLVEQLDSKVKEFDFFTVE